MVHFSGKLATNQRVPAAVNGPHLARTIIQAKTYLDRVGGGRLLSRPRVLRGPSLESPVDAQPLHTPRLELRPYVLGDGDSWFEIVSDPAVIAYLSWPLRDLAAAHRHLRDRTRHTRLWQTDDFLALAVVYNDRLIGDVSLQLRSVNHEVRSVEVGWLLAPEYRGLGLATEAVEAVLHLAFDQVHAQVALAVIHNSNRQSLALARRLGFVEVSRGPLKCLMIRSPS